MAACGRLRSNIAGNHCSARPFSIRRMVCYGPLGAVVLPSHGRGPRFDPLCAHHASPFGLRVGPPATKSRGEACPAKLERSEGEDGRVKTARRRRRPAFPGVLASAGQARPGGALRSLAPLPTFSAYLSALGSSPGGRGASTSGTPTDPPTDRPAPHTRKTSDERLRRRKGRAPASTVPC